VPSFDPRRPDPDPVRPRPPHARRYAARAGAALLGIGLAVAVAAAPGSARDDRYADLPSGPSPTGAPTAPPVALSDAVPLPDTGYPVPAGARVAAPGGRGAACTVADPCALSTALSGAAAGATVVLRGGTYRTGDLVVRKRLTVQPYPHERAWLKGSSEVGGWRRDGAAWRKDGFSACFRGYGDGVMREDLDPRFPAAVLRDMAFRDGRGLRQVTSRAAVRPGSFYVDCAADKLYVGDDPAGHRIEATVAERGLSLYSGAAGTVVRGLGFAHYARSGVWVLAPRVTLERNVMVANAVVGAAMSARELTVRGNVFGYNGRTGASGGALHGSLVEGNLFVGNNTEGFRREWSAAGAKFTRTDRLTVRGNRFEGNFSQGLWLDISMTDNWVVGNTAAHNTTVGLFYEISDRGTFAGNVSYGNGVGLMLSGSSRTRVYNNTLAGNNSNLFVKDSDRRNTDRREIAAGVTWDAYGNVVRNNLSVTPRGAAVVASNCGMARRLRMVDSLDHSGYVRGGGKRLVTWDDGAGRCRVDYRDLPAFRAGTGHERHGVEFEAVTGLFVDAAGHDYRLAGGSPARGKGAPLPADIAAALGLPARRPVGLGAPGGRGVPAAPPVGPPAPSAGPVTPSAGPVTPSAGRSAPSVGPLAPIAGAGSGSGAGTGSAPEPSRTVEPTAASPSPLLLRDRSGGLPLTGASPLPLLVVGCLVLAGGAALAWSTRPATAGTAGRRRRR
jgi:parallel beta-helix repeat protein